MKNIYWLWFIVIVVISCTRKYEETIPLSLEIEEPIKIKQEIVEEEIDSSDYAKIKFDYYEFDAGDVPSGPDIEFEFPFTNVGEYPIVIRHCKSSCGCLVPICDDRFVLPGESGLVRAIHSTKNMTGGTKKTVTVTANTLPERTVLHLQANIVGERK